MTPHAPLSTPVAFGFRIAGVASRGLPKARCPEWPALHVRQCIRTTSEPEAKSYHSEEGARLRLGGGDSLSLDRAHQSATYVTANVIDEDVLVHPWLAPAAGLMAQWLGREAFHAGAFLAGDGAWALTGTNEAGKSSILAALALAGLPVLTDDLLIVDEAGLAYAGPRCIDLRHLQLFGGDLPERVRLVRDGTRHRFDLPATEVAAPLRGWFFLEWGARVEAVPCEARARFGGLIAQRRWATEPIDSHILLELASLPGWTLRRPKGRRHMTALLDLLNEVTDYSATGVQPAAGPSGQPKVA